MRLIEGGEFLMGCDDAYPEEAPARRVTVGSFWMDEVPVTNAQFARFVAATGYETFAEIAPDPRDYPDMAPALARAGSAVFVPPARPVGTDNPACWWRYVFGANWRNPLGPDSSVESIQDHPVVQIAYQDAEAYARWAGKQLPREPEWERAARGGLEGALYAWGTELHPGGKMMANTWQGAFPWQNTLEDGYQRTSPVRSYPSNGFGLYDMIGNVWEWTTDWYLAKQPSKSPCCSAGRMPGAGKPASPEPAGLQVHDGRKVLKGGSHLCAPNYCQRYRPAARFPQPTDSPTSHIGFRCIIRVR